MQDNLKLSKILINSNADVNFQKQVLGLPSIMEKLQVLKTEYGEHEYSYAQTLILYGGDYIVILLQSFFLLLKAHQFLVLLLYLLKHLCHDILLFLYLCNQKV